MTLKAEYENQQKYRKWNLIAEKLPVKSDDIVVELGCGTGSFAEILSKAGRKILPKLKNLGMEILLSENLEDLELTGSGVVSSEFYTMWENRLNRLSFDNFFQDEEIEVIKSEFLSILKDTRHINQSKVKFIIARKY